MARGWESKSVESQIEDSTSSSNRGTGRTEQSPEQIKAAMRRSNLLLSRSRVLHQLENDATGRYAETLRQALAELDAQLSEPAKDSAE